MTAQDLAVTQKLADAAVSTGGTDLLEILGATQAHGPSVVEGTGRTDVSTRGTVLAAIHQPGLAPSVLPAREVRKKDGESDEAAPSRHEGNVVLSVLREAAAHREQFLGQSRPSHLIALRFENLRQHRLDTLI